MATMSIVTLNKDNLNIEGSCLRTKCDEVLLDEMKTEWFKKLIFDMFHTLYSCPNGIGLSANQVGIMKRISIIDRYRDGKDALVLINPSYEPINNEMIESYEACLSFPNISVPVNRYVNIKVSYIDITGEQKSLNVSGRKSCVYQHEIDHLNGIVHVDIAKEKGSYVNYEGKGAMLSQNVINKIFG